jgi:ribosomal protein S18 acetylase RimI-like enzyme
MNTFTLLPLTERDLPALLEIYRACEDFLALGPQPHASEAMVLGDLQLSVADGGQFYGIYVEAGQLAGVADYTPGARRANPTEAHIELLMLAAPYRHRGLGEAVVRRIEAEMWADPRVAAIAVEAQANNPGALRFWQRRGYRIISGPARQADGTTSFQLRKEREIAR